MLNLYSTLSCLPLLVLAAPATHQIPLNALGDRGIPQSLFNGFNDLSKLADITNCLQTVEGITYPFECNSFCREFPKLKLIKQWNTNYGLDLAEESSSGYIAVDHDGGKIFIVVAGSRSSSDTSMATVDYSPLSSGSMLNVCLGCKVHAGFYKQWVKTEEMIGESVKDLVEQYIEAGKENPYQLILVGSKFGGAVAALAAADFEAKGWNPQVTTFGQPKVGNEAFTDYLTGKFTPSTYRRVAHVSDPVPQFPSDVEFSHYEPVYFISKPFVPFTPSDVLICNSSDPDCTSPLNLDWTSTDYFHHTDNCLRETTSTFSLLNFGFDIFEPFTKAKRANSGHQFYTTFEDIDKVPEPEEGKSKQKRDITASKPNTDANTIVSESKLEEIFLMVEPKPEPEAMEEKVYVPEYEDGEIYSVLTGFTKAQGMWLKDSPEKRAIDSDQDTDIGSVVSSGSLRNAFAMLEEADSLTPIEYEDEEIYHTMTGFDKAQRMWIKKPQGVASKKKIPDEFFEEGMLPDGDLVKEKGDTAINPTTNFVGSKLRKGPNESVAIERGVAASNLEKRSTSIQDPVNEAKLEPGSLSEKQSYLVKAGTFLSKIGAMNEQEIYKYMFGDKLLDDENPIESIVSGEIGKVLEKRGLDRALKFFHAPKDVLDAQLAANQEAALYNAQQKAAAKPDVEESESSNPDEDHFKKAGSVLLLNGRPLEVDGHPVLYEPPSQKVQPQRRSQIPHEKSNHGPGLGVKKGGVRRGGSEDKVTELQSLTPPLTGTRSNTVVGVIDNVFPFSSEREVVNVQKGRNVVLMNGRQMPSNFAQKSVRGSGDLLENVH